MLYSVHWFWELLQLLKSVDSDMNEKLLCPVASVISSGIWTRLNRKPCQCRRANAEPQPVVESWTRDLVHSAVPDDHHRQCRANDLVTRPAVTALSQTFQWPCKKNQALFLICYSRAQSGWAAGDHSSGLWSQSWHLGLKMVSRHTNASSWFHLSHLCFVPKTTSTYDVCT